MLNLPGAGGNVRPDAASNRHCLAMPGHTPRPQHVPAAFLPGCELTDGLGREYTGQQWTISIRQADGMRDARRELTVCGWPSRPWTTDDHGCPSPEEV